MLCAEGRAPLDLALRTNRDMAHYLRTWGAQSALPAPDAEERKHYAGLWRKNR